MKQDPEYGRVDSQVLQHYVTDLFTAAGMDPVDAGIVADNLVFADRSGMHSHGVIRVPVYIKRLREGGTCAQGEITIEQETDTTALIQGHNLMGQVVSAKAMQLCMEKAQQHDTAFVGVSGSNHFGMASYYSEMAIPKGMIGMVFTGPAAHLMAPTGGMDPILDNNPFSFAVPAGEELPVVLDMATSVVARGKIDVAIDRGESIPSTWAMTRDGQETTDPREAFNGILLPAGGYKGYGLTVIVGILSCVLTGGSILSREVRDFYQDTSSRQNIGHLFGCIRIDRFMEPELFGRRMDEMIREIKNCRKAPGTREIYLPGEIEIRHRWEADRYGIPITQNTYLGLTETAAELGMEPLPMKKEA